LIEKLKEKLDFLEEKLPLLLVVLFGSYAKGNYTVASDIDLLIIYKGEERKDAFAIAKKTLNIYSLEPHVYSEDEYEKLKGSIHKMIENGVVLRISKQWLLQNDFGHVSENSPLLPSLEGPGVGYI
jgi:predicted nucleotidyltransferase